MYTQAEKLHYELMHARDELTRRINLATDSADAMLSNAAGEHPRNSVSLIPQCV